MSLSDWSYYKKMCVENFSDDGALVGIRHVRGRELWSRRKLRKATECAHCRNELIKGSQAYAPMTNSDYRGNRLCLDCVESARVKP